MNTWPRRKNRKFSFYGWEIIFTLFVVRIKIFFTLFCLSFACDLFFSRFSRPSGSESDSDEEPHKPAGQPVAVRSSSYLTGSGNQANVQHPVANNRGVRPHPLATQINSTPSPQLSLAEFLQDEWVTHSQCGNFSVFLSLRFYVKSNLGIVEVLTIFRAMNFESNEFVQFLRAEITMLRCH